MSPNSGILLLNGDLPSVPPYRARPQQPGNILVYHEGDASSRQDPHKICSQATIEPAIAFILPCFSHARADVRVDVVRSVVL